MSRERRPASPGRLAVAAVVAGVVVFGLQFPWGGGQDSDPPTCFGMFAAWTVPCGGWPTIAAAVLTALLVWVVLLVVENPKLA